MQGIQYERSFLNRAILPGAPMHFISFCYFIHCNENYNVILQPIDFMYFHSFLSFIPFIYFNNLYFIYCHVKILLDAPHANNYISYFLRNIFVSVCEIKLNVAIILSYFHSAFVLFWSHICMGHYMTVLTVEQWAYTT